MKKKTYLKRYSVADGLKIVRLFQGFWEKYPLPVAAQF